MAKKCKNQERCFLTGPKRLEGATGLVIKYTPASYTVKLDEPGLSKDGIVNVKPKYVHCQVEPQKGLRRGPEQIDEIFDERTLDRPEERFEELEMPNRQSLPPAKEFHQMEEPRHPYSSRSVLPHPRSYLALEEVSSDREVPDFQTYGTFSRNGGGQRVLALPPGGRTSIR